MREASRESAGRSKNLPVSVYRISTIFLVIGLMFSLVGLGIR